MDVTHGKIKDIEDKMPDIANVATNTTLNAKINEFKNEISNINNLAKIASIDGKINEVKNEIPNITNFATTAAQTAIENRIPDHHSKCITNQEL